jgi:hypothetical protein
MIGNAIAGLYGVGVTPSTTAYESISTVTVGGGGVSDVTFSSIPSTFTHLQIRFIGKDNRSGVATSVLFMQCNGDTGSTYSQHFLVGDGSTAGAGGGSFTQIQVGDMLTGGTSNASTFGAGVVDILDYANTNKYKTVRSLGGMDMNGSGYAGLYSGNWRNTAAVTSIRLFGFGAAPLQQYSQFALYGIKGA